MSANSKDTIIPVIDLFAGPGGLGEGFASYQDGSGHKPFKISLSIEMDPWAHRTLELRSFYRQFPPDKVPEWYYDYLRGAISRETLFDAFPIEAEAAQRESWRAELGKANPDEVDARIKEALDGANSWVLVGGPPCQAYSTVGRSRMKNTAGDAFANDQRHFLYQEYLRILKTHQPPVFVMENVKGILSSKVNGEEIFGRIVADLSAATAETPGYRVLSFASRNNSKKLRPPDYVLKSENYGIPQTRHRVILLGVRKDVKVKHYSLSTVKKPVTLKDAISDLPRLRSQLTREMDSPGHWRAALVQILDTDLYQWDHGKAKVVSRIKKVVEDLPTLDTGQDSYLDRKRLVDQQSDWLMAHHKWFIDTRLRGVCNHSTRAHMRMDLYRYLYAACFADVHGRSPSLRDFPTSLLPKHSSAEKVLVRSPNKLPERYFADRFRVQLNGHPSKTILAHLGKDGHYFIHPDPYQCRSLTVREAARLQTFPDNYYFEGSKSQQYRQVGNAVPPLLAMRLAGTVNNIVDSYSPIVGTADATGDGISVELEPEVSHCAIAVR